VLGSLAVVDSAGIIIGEIMWVIQQTFAFRAVSESIAVTTRLTVGAFFVFFLRMEKEDGYARLKWSEQGGIRFDVDERTSGDEEGFEGQ
jgi:hypothetical protein